MFWILVHLVQCMVVILGVMVHPFKLIEVASWARGMHSTVWQVQSLCVHVTGILIT